ncbi:MAG TPA: DUF5676 family membrane protein [Patescibacteria group bacterium]|nr:DUF5676 family membrane protein [Patescibacteria group bacterium]
MKHDPKASANAVATTVAAIYIVCALSIVLFPNFVMGIAQSWFHGIDITRIQAFNVTVGSFFYGLITAVIGGWLVGWCFAHCYNFFSKQK